MRSVLLCAIVASLIATASAFVFDPLREHVGALNRVRGVTREQLDHPVSDIPAQWFTQTLDHTDPSNPATYQQRFFLNDQYYNPAAPLIFLTVGGEGPADPGNVDGWWISTPLAQQFGAMQVVLEHRYYGGSMPNDTSVGGMQYLSSSQALADLASFHGYISSTYNLTAQAKWVVWGGSYRFVTPSVSCGRVERCNHHVTWEIPASIGLDERSSKNRHGVTALFPLAVV
jgi:hypothetical protein